MIKTVWMDIGNVLIFFDFMCAYRLWQAASDEVVCINSLRNVVENSGLLKKFDAGQCEVDEFINEIKRVRGMKSVSPRSIINGWNCIFQPNDRTLTLLTQIRPEIQVILVSATNQLHSSFIQEKFGRRIQRANKSVLSCNVGSTKPERSFYQRALGVSIGSANECFYVDDVEQYVKEAGELFGIEGIVYNPDTHLQLEQELKKRGLLLEESVVV